MRVRFVDGFNIRNTYDIDFSGEGSHADYVYIPKGEHWIDKALKNEKKFVLKLVQLKKRLSRLSYPAIRKELQRRLCPQGPKPDVHLKKLTVIDGITVWLVSGSLVRQHYDPEFVQGGHNLVYKYIPKMEIWLDDAFSKDLQFILVHEYVERVMMTKGLNYHDGHDIANAMEKIRRRRHKQQ